MGCTRTAAAVCLPNRWHHAQLSTYCRSRTTPPRTSTTRRSLRLPPSSSDEMPSDDEAVDSFDPDNITDFILDCEMRFDSYPALHGKPARYDTMPAMLAYAVGATRNKEFREVMRDWQRYGIPSDGHGGRTKVRDSTWKEFARALMEIYPAAPLADSAADSLADLKQSMRIVQHNALYTRLSQEAGEVVDVESDSKLAIKRYMATLSRELHPNLSDMEGKSIHRSVDDAYTKGEVRRVKHAMAVAVKQDKLLSEAAKRAGIPGGAYWKHKKSSRSKQVALVTEVDVCLADSPGSQTFMQAPHPEVMRFQEQITGLKTDSTQMRADFRSAVDTLRADTEKRFGVVESKVDINSEMSTQILSKLDSFQDMMKSALSNNTSAVSNNPPQQIPWSSQQAAISYPMPDARQPSNNISLGARQASAPWQYPRRPWQSKGKGGSKGGYAGACFGCGARDHRVANCPNMQSDSNKYLGDAKVNAIAGDILASANNYRSGGTNSLDASQLHEQMNDYEVEWDEATVCHLAIDFAMNVLSPQAGCSRT